jgi:hypothetical protein
MLPGMLLLLAVAGGVLVSLSSQSTLFTTVEERGVAVMHRMWSLQEAYRTLKGSDFGSDRFLPPGSANALSLVKLGGWDRVELATGSGGAGWVCVIEDSGGAAYAGIGTAALAIYEVPTGTKADPGLVSLTDTPRGWSVVERSTPLPFFSPTGGQGGGSP